MARLDLHKIEKHWQKYWEKENINRFFKNSSKPVFSIDTPPPTVSGKMHLGHALAYTQQDVIARYKRMRGFNVFNPFGFDDNGLATERFVEQETGKNAEKMGRKEFIKLCLKETRKAEKELEEDFKSLGLGVDWSLVYRTISDESIAIAQHSFIDLWEQERLYRKETPHMYCPTCKTAIAQAELQDKEKDSYFVDLFFELEDGEGVGKENRERIVSGNDRRIVISTTRPELLPACVAIFVHPEDRDKKGLVGRKAKVPLFGQTIRIMEDKRVEMEKGTGIVMCCTFGDQTDMEWYMVHGLELRKGINGEGKLTELAGEFAGLRAEEGRKKIIERLEEKGFVKGKKKITHTVNVHERCKADVEFLVSEQWFIKYLDLKEEFLKLSEEIKWHPEHMKVRLENWVQGLQWDWCISRQRFFGVSFPVWYCKECGEVKVAEREQLPVDPLVDKPIGKCEKCGAGKFVGEKDVLDTWFTSSLTPQINAKWQLDEEFFSNLFPMDLRPQGHDIITLWGFNTLVKGYLHHRSVPWKEKMINGFALDEHGKKMSKSLGNVIKPQAVLEKYSADVLRYWSCAVTLGEDVPYNEKELVAGKKLVTKMYNAARFVDIISKGERFEELEKGKKEFRLEDRWILSKVNGFVNDANERMNGYDFAFVLNKTRDLFWLDFCDFYLEEVKHRINQPISEMDKRTAQYVLVKVLLDLVKLFAPFLPHITEEIYQKQLKVLGKKGKSIHLEGFPKANQKQINEYDEKSGEMVNGIIAEIRKYKSGEGMPLNAELKKVTVYVKSRDLAERLEEGRETIRNTMKVGTLNLLEAEAGKRAIKINEDIAIEVAG